MKDVYSFFVHVSNDAALNSFEDIGKRITGASGKSVYFGSLSLNTLSVQKRLWCFEWGFIQKFSLGSTIHYTGNIFNSLEALWIEAVSGGQYSTSSRFAMVPVVLIIFFGSLIAVCSICFIDAQPCFTQVLRAFATIVAATRLFYIFSLWKAMQRFNKMAASVKSS